MSNMAEVSYDELMGFISIKVFCPEDPHRNLALRWLAGNIVYTNEQVGSRKRRYTKLFGPAGQVMLDALRQWFGEDTPRCWSKLADMFEDSAYFSVFEVVSEFRDTPIHAVRLHVGKLLNEAYAARVTNVSSGSG